MYIKPAARKKARHKRRLQKAFTNFDMRLDNDERIKRFYPVSRASQNIKRQCRARKKGERRRISMALNEARYDSDVYIVQNPLASNYLYSTVHYEAI